MTVRSPIVCVLGHVDHGKTVLLDKIRGTAIASKEPGLITQHVGASFIPIDIVEKRCSNLLKKHNFKLSIPGLLFIDTPGHEAFTNLRKRGGSIADLAVVVIDIMQGIQPQTVESIEILKTYKTPFIVAANKIDLISGWIPNKDSSFLESFQKQQKHVQDELDEKVYRIVRQLANLGFDSERFDRVTELKKQVLIVPTSGKTGEGFQELLMFLAGLSQKYMGKKLHVSIEKGAVGTVLEVKKVQGLGMTIDSIIYEGVLKQGDKIAIATKDGKVLITKVRALLQPAPLEEIRDPHKKFKKVTRVYAAAGLKLAAPNLEQAVAGSPLMVVVNEKKAIEKIEEELEQLKIENDINGVIIKTDALGSLEAITNLFKDFNLAIRRADIGPVTKKDLIEAEAIKKEDRYLGVIFAFNTSLPDEIKAEAQEKEVPIFESKIIYKLEEDYKKWKKEEQVREKEEKLTKYIYPAKVKILPECIFRISKPAVVGVEVLGGTIKAKYPLMSADGEPRGIIVSIQEKNQHIEKAEKGMQVAIAIEGVTVGRQIHEQDILYTAVPIDQIYSLIGKFEDQKLLEEIKRIREKT